MGSWAREAFKSESTDRHELVREISEFSINELAANPDRCLHYIYNNYDLMGENYVIEGMRNPRDFFHLYSNWDIVIHLDFLSNDNIPTSVFDGGVDIIRDYMSWATDIGLLPKEKYITCAFAAYDDAHIERVGLSDEIKSNAEIYEEKLCDLIPRIVNLVTGVRDGISQQDA